MNHKLTIRNYTSKDLPEMITIWNEVVKEGIAFPQEELLNEQTGRDFFASQTYAAVAVGSDIPAVPEQDPEKKSTDTIIKNLPEQTSLSQKSCDNHEKIYGLYILHPNNVGRCGHICNASYAVSEKSRGKHIGEKLVLDCLTQAKAHGFGILQFNAVVESNIHARHLYERLGFTQLGTIPDGFRMKDGHFENICPYYYKL